MKKKSLALLTIALALTTVTFAQGFHLGFKAGANIFKVDGKSFNDEFKFGYNLGAFAEINFSNKWGVQPELLWNQTNYRTGDNFDDLYPGGKNDVEGKLNYISIPILLTYRPVKIFSLQAGPQFGILTSQDKDLLGETKEAFKSGDFSMLGGAQLNLGALRVGGRYVVGLTDINDIDNRDKWKNQGFQLYLGLTIL
ncbi:PorT family protein [Pseudoflavitalea sp. X16]|uniref:porin family protein n=1 Tax=Paraflavitalea devenefica TaxID=2716334 RepID=UPI0014248B14|nr:porin family protein [Paraflavitalea devenefica]NII27238.1 PorT family protein [Paraflavitalea devenefica]